jgi:murein DD-endopeptidase / murein LD-carboxypeptidase
MTMDYAARARALVGTPFRPQGRGEGGLDCVGVVVAAFGISPEAVRRDYRLSGDHLHRLRAALEEHFRPVPKTQVRAGDVMVLAPSAKQFHLAIQTNRAFVHAHAGIGFVVETPGAPEWPLIAVYRKRRSH